MATVAVHFYFVSYGIAIVNVPTSLSREADWVVGIVVGALGFAGMLSRPLVGIWVDSSHRERWLHLGGAATVVAFIGYTLSLDPWIMLGFRFIHGIAMGLFTTSLLAIVASHIPARQRGVGIGLYQSGNAAAQLYASALAVMIATQLSHQAAFMAGAVAAGCALLSGIVVRDLEPPPGQHGIRWRDREWVSSSAITPAIVFLMMTSTVGAINAFMPLFAEERSLGNAGLYYTVWGSALLGARFGAGAIGDRYGRDVVVFPSLLAQTASLVMLSAAHTPLVMLVSAAIGGVALGGVQISTMSLIVERAAPARRGAAMATYTMAWDVGAVTGGGLLGFIIDATSYSSGFLLIGLLPLCGLVIYLVRIRATDGGQAAT